MVATEELKDEFQETEEIDNYNPINYQIGWIDALRTFAILMVMFYTVLPDNPAVNALTTPVRLPLLYAISGFLMMRISDTEGRQNKRLDSFGKFVWGIFKLILLWLFLGLVPMIFSLPTHGVECLTIRLENMVTNVNYQFVPCFIIAKFLHYILRAFSNLFSRYSSVVLVILSLAITILAMIYFEAQSPEAYLVILRKSLTAQLFFMIGYLIALSDELFDIIVPDFGLILVFAIYIALCVVVALTLSHSGTFFAQSLNFVSSTIGIFAFFIVCMRLQFNSVLYGAVSSCWFLIYMWRMDLLNMFQMVLGSFGANINIDFLYALLLTVLVCLTCMAVATITHSVIMQITGNSQALDVE
ncbi:MAG: acyltransferase family protein [Bacteroidaceae bacterium]|nr:acyltransferase family protein [Bacteroidaceae bacterium]